MNGRNASNGPDIGGWTALELISGSVRGIDLSAQPLPTVAPGTTTREALEQSVRQALRHPPCIVSFSGGRDSSALLALAVNIARRDGLAPPVPVTLRFPGRPDAEEGDWQELVLRHIGADDWVKLSFDNELDFVGPHATTVLQRHGLLWPANAHSHLPMAAHASGGSMITGFGGDEVLQVAQLWSRVNRVLTGQVRGGPRDVVRLAAFHGPRPVRRHLMRRRVRGMTARPWLRPDAERAVVNEEVSASLLVPLRRDDGIVTNWWPSRYRRMAENAMSVVGAFHGTTVHHPFSDPVVLGALAREGGRAGFSSRTTAMEHLFGDLLPREVLSRASKAVLTGAFWTPLAAAFADRWDGSGVNADLVDPDVLRDYWRGRPTTDFRTAPLLQSAWLATEGANTRARRAPEGFERPMGDM